MEDEDGSTPNQSRRYKKIKNVQLIPPDSPEIVDHFIHSFTPPEGWERMPTPKKSGHRSMIYEYGVKCKRAVRMSLRKLSFLRFVKHLDFGLPLIFKSD